MKAKKFILSLLFVGVSATSFARDWYVDGAVIPGEGNGSQETPYGQIYNVFTNGESQSGDVIWVSNTVMELTSMSLSGKYFTIKGTNKATSIIDGGFIDKGYFMRVAATPPASINMEFEDLTFQNFANPTTNAGVFQFASFGVSLMCRNVTFKDNTAYNGGAITMGSGTLVLEDCTFVGNSAKKNGTNINADGGVLNLSGGTNSFSVTIDRCLFENNVADRRGSAIYLRLSNGTIAGGATFDAMIRNSTFVGNQITAIGVTNLGDAQGTILLMGNDNIGTLKMVNNTIVENTSLNTEATRCAGLFVNGLSGIITLQNNIIANNTNANSKENISITMGSGKKFQTAKNNLTDQTFDFVANSLNADASNNRTVTFADLQLDESLAENGGKTKTKKLNTGSVAINAGLAQGAPTVDQRGSGRSSKPDAGAYDTNTTPSSITQITNTELFEFNEIGLLMNVDGLIEVFDGAGNLLQKRYCSVGESVTLSKGLHLIRCNGAALKVNR